MTKGSGDLVVPSASPSIFFTLSLSLSNTASHASNTHTTKSYFYFKKEPQSFIQFVSLFTLNLYSIRVPSIMIRYCQALVTFVISPLLTNIIRFGSLHVVVSLTISKRVY